MRYSLRRNHTSGVPASHVVFDTETVPAPTPANPSRSVHRLRLGVARYFRFEAGKPTRSKELVFRHPDVFRGWLGTLTHRKNPLWVWSHNAGFDLAAVRFWDWIEAGHLRLERIPPPLEELRPGQPRPKYRPGVLVTQDPPTVVRCYTPAGHTVWFCDMLNWFPRSLKELGDAVHLPKQDMPGEVATEEAWESYCRRDVAILEATLQELLSFVRALDLGNFRTTAAAQSMAWFRHAGRIDHIRFDDRDHVRDFERSCYFGCRKAAYFQGDVVPPGWAGIEGLHGVKPQGAVLHEGPVYHLDLTAAYPWAMRENVYPVSYLHSSCTVKPDELARQMEVYCAGAHVRISSYARTYPVRRGKHTYWACGHFDTYLCGPELLGAIRDGDVTRVHRAQLYVADCPFDSWVEAGWKARLAFREQGRKLWEGLVKQLMNALHGKFGQREHRWELVPGEVAENPWGYCTRYDAEQQTYDVCRGVGGYLQRRTKGGHGKMAFPLIPAYCTAYVRDRMRTVTESIGRHNVLYEDVDSLHVTQFAFSTMDRLGLIADCALGSYKVERWGDHACYRGPGDYQLGDHRVLVGLSKKATQDERGMWHQTNWDRIDSLLSGPPPAGPVTNDVTLPRPHHPISGRVRSDGWVEPVRLEP